MKKFIAIAFMALAVTMIAWRSVPALASDVTPSPTPTAVPNPYSKLIVRSDGTINMSNVYDAYNSILTQDQKDLCNYLVGLSQYMYLTARGFKYETVTNGAQLVSMLASAGARFFDVTPTNFSSRLTAYMQQFISACVSYAGTVTDINGNLGTWIENHEEDLYIPYTDNSLASWTAYYNDPSNIGVVNWGVYDSDWVSGDFVDYAFADIPFGSGSLQTQYNNFILNNSPVIYSHTYGNQYVTSQTMIGLSSNKLIDSLFIKRGSLTQARFGYSDFSTSFPSGNYPTSLTSEIQKETGSNYVNFYVGNGGVFYRGIINVSNASDYRDVIEYCFNVTPFGIYNYPSVYFWYPYVNHVYLVDDLNTLANPEEISDTVNFGINDDNAKWIKTPKGQVLYYPIGSGAVLNEYPLPENLKKDDGQGNLISIDPTQDLKTEIVNNTVINNYNIVAPGSIINVPVDWLEGEGNYLSYTNTAALPFFVMVGDIFNALGEIRIFIVAVLIMGLAGGVLVKFLL